jgi:ketose-bisphosphate aldolase
LGNLEFIRSIYRKASEQGFAIGAYNFSTMDIAKGIHRTAVKMKAPVIMSNSEGERAFFGLEESVALYQLLKQRHPQTILHADHTKTFEEIKKVIDAGYPSVHFDGSELSYETNLRETKRCADYAHSKGVFIEGELGGIRGGSTTHTGQSLKDVIKPELLTKPEQAKEFCEMTGVDSLAISIGNAHGLWAEQKKLDFERIKRVKAATGRFLVLHGGSGITSADFRKAILCGINKININTEMRMAYEKALLQGLAERTDDVPYHYLAKVGDSVAKVVEEKMIIFRTEGKI